MGAAWGPCDPVGWPWRSHDPVGSLTMSCFPVGLQTLSLALGALLGSRNPGPGRDDHPRDVVDLPWDLVVHPVSGVRGLVDSRGPSQWSVASAPPGAPRPSRSGHLC